MSGNSFGTIFRITTFGESHGEMIGVVIDGCPSGITLDLGQVQKDLDLRRPGQSKITTARKEADQVRFVSGLFEGKTTGMPITALIENQDARSGDYEQIKDVFRPSHADYTYEKKYGHRDYRGGGRSSARETAARVVAGSIAKQILKNLDIHIFAYVSAVGPIEMSKFLKKPHPKKREESLVRCPDLEASQKMIKLIEEIKSQGDTIGGVVSCLIQGVPVGLGEPVFDKLQAELAHAMMSINAAKAFEVGDGFNSSKHLGSEFNDLFIHKKGKIQTQTNHSGGIQGGISNGMDIHLKVTFKPVATLMQDQISVNAKGDKKILKARGRHDPCVVPRAVPIVEAMAAIVVLDQYLRNLATQIKPKRSK